MYNLPSLYGLGVRINVPDEAHGNAMMIPGIS